MKKINWSKLYKRVVVIAIIAVFVTILSYLLNLIPFVNEIELKLTDFRFRLDTKQTPADSSIVIVAIDDSSLDFFENNGVTWPWPRSYYGYLVDYLHKSGARSVFFDVIFDSPDTEREETTAAQTDGQFAAAMKEANVVLGAKLVQDSTRISNKITNYEQAELPWLATSYAGIRAPIDTLLTASSALGIINVTPSSDGIIRKVPLLYQMQTKKLLQMSLSVYLQNHTIKQLKQPLPTDSKGQYLVNWYDTNSFKYYPFQAVIQSAAAAYSDVKPVLPVNTFQDKYVIIGATATGLNDLRATPLSGSQPGLEIWTTILSNFLQGDYVNDMPLFYALILAFLVSFVVMRFISHYQLKIANPAILLLLLILVVFYFLIWWQGRVLLNFIIPILAYFISYLLYITISYLAEGKSRAEIKKIFSRYLSPDVISELEEEPEKIILGGKEIKATIMFSDIYNFTTYSEGKSPQVVVKNLNEYFERITTFVLENNGLLDKYTGDGIMALFGVPVFRKDHAFLACKAALQHKEFCNQLSQQLDDLTIPEKLHMKTRLGINSGDIIAGNIGSEKRMDYTAIGDAANLAARLEGVNKIYQTNIIISETTYDLVKDNMVCRELDFLRVKGKSEPTRIYELLWEKGKEERWDWLELYEQALELYRKKEWQKAAQIFSELQKPPISDPPSKVMLDRCRYLIENPPEKWDGILTLEVK